ncbi:unnamed protein product [Calypogeia fissa]
MGDTGSHVPGRVFRCICPPDNRPPVPSDLVCEDRYRDGSRLPEGVRASFSRLSVVGWPVAIFIDGACRGNGQPGARAAFGVYTARNSPHNTWDVLPNWARHTNQVAEIYAAQQAVDIILNDSNWEGWQNGVVLVTDSTYLFLSMTRYIHNWSSNGFLDANGRPVVNRQAFEQLDSSICALERRGIKILFWRVDREHNQDADHLANLALGPQRRCRACFEPLWIEVE